MRPEMTATADDEDAHLLEMLLVEQRLRFR
jgi:hypothetical protein